MAEQSRFVLRTGPANAEDHVFPLARGRPAGALYEVVQDEQHDEADDDHREPEQQRADATHDLCAEESRDLHGVPRPS